MQRHRRSRLARIAGASLAVAALAAAPGGAAARPADMPPPTHHPAAAQAPAVTAVSRDEGFDWGSAGIGAAAGAGLILAGAGTLVVARHSRLRPAR
jgi:hypothetical protein